jgi:DNA end-binding protein Ku
LATELIQRKTKPFDPAAFKDSYAEALEQLVERKRKGHAIVTTGEEERRPPAKVINLIEALKKSVGQRSTTGERGRGATSGRNAPDRHGSGRSKTTRRAGAAKKRA